MSEETEDKASEEKKEEVKEKIPEVKVSVKVTAEPSILDEWQPKTALGKKVFSGEITDIDSILDAGLKITEPEIVDKLVPNTKSELILIGGRTGKGGGIQRIPVKITAAMHKSGRRFTTNAFAAVGNEDGLLGIGKGSAVESRDAIFKATQKAKMNLIKIIRGCGSWECGCCEPHSIKFKASGKSGSVRAELLPAPKGVGLATDDETKKVLRLAGIKDVWIKTYGNTKSRINLISAIFDALKKLYVYERGE